MRSLLNIPISVELEILVKKGDKVRSGDVLAKKTTQAKLEKIPVSKILSIPPDKIISFIVPKLGSKVKKGEILAKKDGVFKNISILSPHDGKLESVDLKEGVIILISERAETVTEISPIDGVIEEITNILITISVSGKIIEGEKGKGGHAVGLPLFFSKHVDMFDFTEEVRDRIIISSAFTDEARAKLNALGAKGIIATQYYEDYPVMVAVSEKSLKELLPVRSSLVLLGDKKQIIIPV